MIAQAQNAIRCDKIFAGCGGSATNRDIMQYNITSLHREVQQSQSNSPEYRMLLNYLHIQLGIYKGSPEHWGFQRKSYNPFLGLSWMSRVLSGMKIKILHETTPSYHRCTLPMSNRSPCLRSIYHLRGTSHMKIYHEIELLNKQR